jgi:hypothetical protein
MPAGAKITPAMFDAALQVRADVRAYLRREPTERRRNKEAVRLLNGAMRLFPVVAEAQNDSEIVLRAAGGDALAGLSQVVALSPNCMKVPSRELWID